MYIRENRSIANVHGMREVSEKENPFLKPSIIASVPFGGIKSTNGYFSKVLDLLGLRHGNSINSGIDISQVPFSLVSDRKGEEITEKLLPIIPENDKEKAKDILRNITIFSYCNGNENTYSIIMSIHDDLVNKGYSEEDIKDIMSQIVVLQVVANLSKGTFPYVTSVIFHDIYDIENTRWVEMPPENFPTDTFSKVIVGNVNDNCTMLLNSSFGEESLKANFPNDHSFSNDYFGAPVLGSIMSICFINSLSRSIDKKDVKVSDILENIDDILKMAKEYEDTHKDLDGLTKEELTEFRELFSKYLFEYSKKNLKAKEIDPRFLELDKERTEVIELLRSKSLYSLPYVYEISSAIRKILEYYGNFDNDEVVNIRIGNSGGVHYVVGEFIKQEIKVVNKKIRELVTFLNGIVLPDTVSVEIRKELEEYKYSILSNLLSDEVKSIIREYELNEVLDSDVTIGGKKL